MSFVGNEYWAGSIATSSDPAAASCTQVAIISIMMEMTMMMMAKMKMKDIVTISFKRYKDSGAAEPLGEPGVLWGKQQAGHKGGKAGHAEGVPEPVLNGFKE